MLIQIDTSSMVGLSSAWAQAPEIVIEELTAATLESEMLLERETKDRTPVGVGGASGLRGNIHSTMPEVLGDTVIGQVGSTLSYAEAVELGTYPHPVSAAGVQAIEDWVRAKLGVTDKEAQRVANAVAWNIRAHGTPGVGMFHGALAFSREQLQMIFQAAAGRVADRLMGAPQ